MLPKAGRYGVVCVLAISGLVISLRMLFGPFDAPLRVRTPLNPEGWFGLAAAILLMTGRHDAGDKKAARHRLSRWWWAVATAALLGITTATFWRTIHFYFLSDDFVLVNHASRFHFDLRPLFGTAGGDGFFRPIGNLSLAWTWMWAGVNPMRWHATALVLHGANVVLVFTLATRLSLSRLSAWFAATLFAIHGTRPEAATWIAGRFDLVATFFVLAGLLFFIRSHGQESSIGYVYELASLTCMVLAILSKESAYVFPLLLGLFLVAKRDLCQKQVGVLNPFFVTATALFAYRWWLFNGIGGYRDEQTGHAQALTFGLVTLKALAVRIWTALFFPINWSAEPGKWFAALMLAYMGAVAWLVTTRQNRRLIGVAVGFVIVCALPPLHLLGIGAGLGNSRLLYLPSVGFCIMLALAVDGLRGRGRWVIPTVILAFHVAALQHNLNEWEYASRKARAATSITRECIGPVTAKITDFGIPGTLRGVPFFANVYSDHLQFVSAAQTHTTGCTLRQRSSSPKLEWDASDEEVRCVILPQKAESRSYSIQSAQTPD